MQGYPYSCLEQKVSKAIGTADRRAWDGVAGQMPVYLDSDGLAWYFPSPPVGLGSDVLTSYILSVANEAGYPIPDETSARMLSALDAYVQGRIKRKGYDEWSRRPDMPVRKLLAIEALARYGKATPAHLATVEISPGLWPTGAVVAWLDILQRMPDVQDRAQRIAEAEAILRTRMVASGTLTQFANEGEDYWWWLMMSPDNTAVRAVSALMDSPQWQREIPRRFREHDPAQLEQIQPGAHHHLGRFRCALSRSPGFAQSEGGRLRMGDTKADGSRRSHRERPNCLGARGRL